eukprot:TRINITY_DN7022_c0_g1_i1.p1 TRINITY_DN7022_c0_g1~~TRINITY_DN7022_c0_g1_i1.p1  ORF type:complete len:102 (+),score=6.75 TRINITY_DN7022_c0_g1_i1:920-1225(+)
MLTVSSEPATLSPPPDPPQSMVAPLPVKVRSLPIVATYPCADVQVYTPEAHTVLPEAALSTACWRLWQAEPTAPQDTESTPETLSTFTSQHQPRRKVAGTP